MAMQTDEFEWDDGKAARNLVKHGVSFEEATFAFDDPDGLDIIDQSADYREDRFKLIGSNGQRLLAVIHTDREPRIRIISAREAEPYEHARYHQRRGPG